MIGVVTGEEEWWRRKKKTLLWLWEEGKGEWGRSEWAECPGGEKTTRQGRGDVQGEKRPPGRGGGVKKPQWIEERKYGIARAGGTDEKESLDGVR